MLQQGFIAPRVGAVEGLLVLLAVSHLYYFRGFRKGGKKKNKHSLLVSGLAIYVKSVISIM